MREPTRSLVPLRDRDAPVVLSGSALDQLANTCALQWFLGREVKADAPASAAQGFGNVVHVLADEVASGRTPADLDVLMERLDSVWDALAFDAPWKSVQEKENARQALERFLEWHTLDRAGRTPVASEHDFDVTLGAGPYEVRIRGSMDRVEQDPRGRAYVVDFKTGKQAPTAAEVAHHPQLAVYQLAVTEGAVDPLFDGVRPEPGGAELVHLRQPAPKKDGGDALPRVQHQPRPRASGSATSWPPPRARSSTNASPPPPDSTAPTAPSAPRAAPGRKGGRWWSEPRHPPGALSGSASPPPARTLGRPRSVTDPTTPTTTPLTRQNVEPRRCPETRCRTAALASLACPHVSATPSSSRSSSASPSLRSRWPASPRPPLPR
ncbi:hypothetical protein SF12_10720 [Streptomyces sp. MBRL 601]|nr:hypothetical protein SF12_10720 [Streptomyces sp. MBRL 601]